MCSTSRGLFTHTKRGCPIIQNDQVSPSSIVFSYIQSLISSARVSKVYKGPISGIIFGVGIPPAELHLRLFTKIQTPTIKHIIPPTTDNIIFLLLLLFLLLLIKEKEKTGRKESGSEMVRDMHHTVLCSTVYHLS